MISGWAYKRTRGALETCGGCLSCLKQSVMQLVSGGRRYTAVVAICKCAGRCCTNLWVFVEGVVQSARRALEHARNVGKRQTPQGPCRAGHRSATLTVGAFNATALAIARPSTLPARVAKAIIEISAIEEFLRQCVGKSIGNRSRRVWCCGVAWEVLLFQHPLAHAVISPTVERVGAQRKARAP